MWALDEKEGGREGREDKQGLYRVLHGASYHAETHFLLHLFPPSLTLVILNRSHWCLITKLQHLHDETREAGFLLESGDARAAFRCAQPVSVTLAQLSLRLHSSPTRDQ